MSRVMYKRFEWGSVWDVGTYWNPAAGKVLCRSQDRWGSPEVGEVCGLTPEVVAAIEAAGDGAWYELALESESAARKAGADGASWFGVDDWNEDELAGFFAQTWAGCLERGPWYLCLDPDACSEKQLEGAVTLEEVAAAARTGDAAEAIFRDIAGGVLVLEGWELESAALLQRRMEASKWFYGRICDLYGDVPADLRNRVAGEAAVMWCESSGMPARNELTDQLDEVLDRALELRDGDGVRYADRLGVVG